MKRNLFLLASLGIIVLTIFIIGSTTAADGAAKPAVQDLPVQPAESNSLVEDAPSHCDMEQDEAPCPMSAPGKSEGPCCGG